MINAAQELTRTREFEQVAEAIEFCLDYRRFLTDAEVHRTCLMRDQPLPLTRHQRRDLRRLARKIVESQNEDERS